MVFLKCNENQGTFFLATAEKYAGKSVVIDQREMEMPDRLDLSL